ncbi:MAG: endolytic transglycosylase MltG [Gammaproteobacteria bacterium]|nr:endolytic transglycosylase MltG [Gammaproteobacteria bacterium]MBU1625171.1 endolytic transglycosylase MltG [Gammaproteobacteria bacterium]MBU1981431.1 endolytic transglycosylase MltG [Gammaproteobacteria bacterium]
MRRTNKLNVIRSLLVVLTLSLAFVSYHLFSNLSLDTLPIEFEIEQGSTLKHTTAKLKQAGVLESDWSFILLARVTGKAKRIKFGNYLLEKPVSRYELLDMISEGRTDQSQIQIRIIEGITFKELRKQMDAHPKVRHDSAAMTEAELLQSIGATEQAAEGLFFPDTYYFATGSSDLTVYKRAYQTLHSHLEAAWQQRDPKSQLSSPYDALVLASIVEKETGKATDRPMIATVFLNRLRRGMRLQTDPTVIYGMGDAFDGNLRKRDLKADTPYNTYTRYGLPPTPIALPGLESIQAVMHEPLGKQLYFVAKGDGSSHFSHSLIEHNKAVIEYQLKRK